MSARGEEGVARRVTRTASAASTLLPSSAPRHTPSSPRLPAAASAGTQPSANRTVVDSEVAAGPPTASDEAVGADPAVLRAPEGAALTAAAIQSALEGLHDQGIQYGNVDAAMALTGVGASPPEAEAELASARLSDDAVAKYRAACERGVTDLLDVAAEAIAHVVANPHTIRQRDARLGARGGGGKRARELAAVDLSDVHTHGAVRFACYERVRRRLQYEGPRILLPYICEKFIKGAFPGTGEFTGFISSRSLPAAGAGAALPAAVNLQYPDDEL